MTQKRKAELQRKLSMAPVAKPPSDLADRIKAGIPDYLDARHDRERLSRSIGMSLRIAASIILLVTSAFLAVEFLSRGQEPERGKETAVPATAVAEATAPERAAAAPAADSLPAAPPPEPQASAAAAPAARTVVAPAAAAPPTESQQATRTSTRRVEKAAELMATETRPAAAPPLAAAAPPPAVEAAAADTADAMAESIEPTAGRSAAAVMTMDRVAVANFQRREQAPRQEVERLRKVLSDGANPAAVDVGAVVDHFAGPPQSGLEDVRLEVEASHAPLASENVAVIRYTIDVPHHERTRMAKLTIALESSVIESYRTISGPPPQSSSDRVLESGTSVTGLVEVRLAPDLAPDQRVATILLDYVSAASGEKGRAARPVYARDLGRSWQSASRRHRLATLSATWSESLRGARTVSGVAVAAAELAREAPGDERARELAALTASSRPRNSSPTGSGR